ncbi:hypothetical protein B0A50_00819 [Salinomyces thailandicus]|uniref:SHD domain-containing protein n=1 Tax=Salinomyces thailandicus TaxID=706561 RepID=A0A4U0UF75_9PEZI|nr:hypothetical protein B0A50_00819 [Salinomyces thailandica]
MAAIQLNFTLRTSANCKTVHLLGSWDNYNGQLPLSKDSSKTGGWKGTFRFQGKTLKQGQRYWYYYIIDGYHVSHDPAREAVTEPTTGRKLNILDIPAAKSAEAAAPVKSSSRHTRRVSTAAVPKGRSLSPSQIQSPKPMRPTETSQIRGEAYAHATVEQLTRKFATTELSDSDDSSEEDSDAESDVPSLSSRSSASSTPSSVSSTSSCCTCERYGITRAGSRVKLDCGGSRCGASDSSECSSESEPEVCTRSARRHGIVVRK